ncbi:hypothetical protein DFH06DRAFT_1068755 [Mycena polygramma]|nr:hypothetical protein DFH06DRAFT_1068755 [Mycena polygramma]
MAGAPRLNKRSRHSNPDVLLSGVPEVPLDTFFTSLLPSASSDACAAVKAQLVDRNHLLNDTWSALNAENTSRKAPMNGLRCIFDAVVGVASDILDDVLGPRRNELFVRSDDPRLSDYLPHAEFQLVDHDEKDEPAWFSTVIPWRVDGDAYDPTSNHDTLIWNCHDILREDARRRFTFGITMDADEMRIWFFSRTHNVVSTPFNATREPDTLIRLFIAIAFATPEQLGYDTTMSYVIDDFGSVQFKLALNGTTYITKQLLSDNRSDSICGRGTRVWDAYREDDPDRISVAIKDLWTSLNAVPEGTQLLDLHTGLRALSDPETSRPPGDYFLTVVSHGFVQTTDGVDDHTVDVMLRGHSFQVASADHSPRKHYRIVFKEVGVPLDRLRSMSEIFQALADATRALSLLHRLGFAHRDVSAGNILLYDGMGKLTDLEYVESLEKLASNPGLPCIGTPEYTSYEVATDSYTWEPSPGTIPVVEKTLHAGEVPMPPFRFNPLHDLESTLWIALWAVLYHRRQDQVHAQLLQKYFPERPSGQGTATITRMVALKSGFPRPPHDDSSASTIGILNLVRMRLLEQYLAFEQDFSHEYAALDPLPTLDSPLQVAQDIIAHYEEAALLSQHASSATAVKRKADGDLPREKSHSVPSSLSPGTLSEKHESATKKSSSPNKTSRSSSRKTRSAGLHASRRSSRIAARKKKAPGGLVHSN